MSNFAITGQLLMKLDDYLEPLNLTGAFIGTAGFTIADPRFIPLATKAVYGEECTLTLGPSPCKNISFKHRPYVTGFIDSLMLRRDSFLNRDDELRGRICAIITFSPRDVRCIATVPEYRSTDCRFVHPSKGELRNKLPFEIEKALLFFSGPNEEGTLHPLMFPSDRFDQ